MRESAYQRKLIEKIETLLPGCLVIRNDPRQNQGIPDITVLYENRWGMLEVKISTSAAEQPNQAYFVERYNDMSFAAFVCPQNEEQVLHDLQQALRTRRKARIS